MTETIKAAIELDYAILGAGVIGLAIGKAISNAYPDQELIVFEQHATFGEETSSRNSEVIHAGIYYPQTSLKAKLCVEGKTRLYEYCKHRNVPFKNTGKLIVASEPNQTPELAKIQTKANNNGVEDLVILDGNQVNALEPNVKACQALLSPSTGIIDSHQLMLSLVGEIEDAGNTIAYRHKIIDIEKVTNGWRLTVLIDEELFQISCRWLINAAGLHAHQLANLYQDRQTNVYYCRGLYFSYSQQQPLFNHLIYPVPEANTVGLGIHATLDLSGQTKFGPDTEYINALDYQFPETPFLHTVKDRWLEAIRRYFPEVNPARLQPGYSGIRPKLTQAHEAAADFVIEGSADHQQAQLIQLLGIESPGLTSCLAIADYVLNLIKQDL